MANVAINGFGRIGRNAFKIAFGRPGIEIVAINDLTDTKTLAYLLRHDSNYGTYHHEVGFDDQNIIVDGKKVRVLAEKDPTKLPWKDLNVDIVIESTGRFTKHEDAAMHLTAGAKRVVISAPEKGDEAVNETFVIGANADKLGAQHEVISNASCTTNCIAPVMAVLSANPGIEKSMMTTVHSYTASQVLQDAPAKDLREGRNAAENIVPTTTGAATAAAMTLPDLKGKFDGLSIRVPTPVVSLSDITFVAKKATTVEEINKILKDAAANPIYKGILTVTEEELVSSDFIGDSHSAIVDLNLTNVVDGNLVKVVAWYDNEWGYSNRLVEMVELAAKTLTAEPAAEPAAAQQSASAPTATPAAPTTAPVPVAVPVAATTPPAPQAAQPTPAAQVAATPVTPATPSVPAVSQATSPSAPQPAPAAASAPNTPPTDLPLIPTDLTPNPEVLVQPDGQVTQAPAAPTSQAGVQQ